MDINGITDYLSNNQIMNVEITKIKPVESPGADNVTKDLNEQMLARKEEERAKKNLYVTKYKKSDKNKNQETINKTNSILVDYPYSIFDDISNQKIYAKKDPTDQKGETMLVISLDCKQNYFAKKVNVKKIDNMNCSLSEIFAFISYKEINDNKLYVRTTIKILEKLNNFNVNEKNNFNDLLI